MTDSPTTHQSEIVRALQDRLLKETTQRYDSNASQDIRNLSIALGVAWDKLYRT